MSLSRKSLLQVLPLVLFLLAGQLQAKTVSTCLMINGDSHGATVDIQDMETCHHDHKVCLSLDYDDVASLDTDSCHIKIVVPGNDQDSQLNTSAFDLVIESDIDPPQEKFISLNPIFQLRATAFIRSFPRISYLQVGSKIHLITQRLRI